MTTPQELIAIRTQKVTDADARIARLTEELAEARADRDEWVLALSQVPTWEQVQERFAADFAAIPHWVEMAHKAWESGDYTFDANGVVQRKVDL